MNASLQSKSASSGQLRKKRRRRARGISRTKVATSSMISKSRMRASISRRHSRQRLLRHHRTLKSSRRSSSSRAHGATISVAGSAMEPPLKKKKRRRKSQLPSKMRKNSQSVGVRIRLKIRGIGINTMIVWKMLRQQVVKETQKKTALIWVSLGQGRAMKRRQPQRNQITRI